MTSILYDKYVKDIQPTLQKSLGIKNKIDVPGIEKVIIASGIGSYLQRLGSKDPSYVVNNLTQISGRKPILRKAKKAVSNFKLREGMPVGVSVTLRGREAYDFVYKLINIVFPRVRDFRGTKSNIFDANGNCSIGLNDHTVFPEVSIPEDMRKIHGIQVTIVTTAKNPEQGKALLTEFGFPFKKK
jgi:large subunit ribosomal protein L5